jgi:hypothetical protein
MNQTVYQTQVVMRIKILLQRSRASSVMESKILMKGKTEMMIVINRGAIPI